jgi:ATP-dependent Clp protease ATP-binding subunit ClpC
MVHVPTQSLAFVTPAQSVAARSTISHNITPQASLAGSRLAGVASANRQTQASLNIQNFSAVNSLRAAVSTSVTQTRFKKVGSPVTASLPTRLMAAPNGNEPDGVNRAKYLRPKSQVVIHKAAAEAGERPLEMAHLIITLFDQLGLNQLSKFGINANTLRRHIGLDAKPEQFPDSGSAEDAEQEKTVQDIKDSLYLTGDLNALTVSEDVDELLANLYEDNGYRPIDENQLILGVLRHIDEPGSSSMALLQELMEANTDLDKLIDGIAEEALSGKNPQQNGPETPSFQQPTTGVRNGYRKPGAQDYAPNPADSPSVASWRATQANRTPTPILDKLGVDLTLQAANGLLGPAFGRDEESRDVVIALNARQKGSAVLVGPPGTGKTALVEGLAVKIVNGDYAKLKDYRVVSVSVGSMLSGTQYRGALEKNIEEMIKEAKGQKIIIFVDEIHGIIGGGKTTEGTADIANYLKAARNVKWLGATTEGEYTRYFKKDPALDRRFEKITLKEPDRETTRQILVGVVPRLAEHHNVTYTDTSIEATQNYCERYVPGHHPDKEISALDMAGAYAGFHEESTVTPNTIATTLEKRLGIPLTKIKEDNASPDAVRSAIRKHVIGQNMAVDAIAKAIFQARAGVNPDRPFVMVFAGPTGTGKTELAKAIANIDGRNFVRINLETIKNISSLKGAEPGFVGHEQEGILTGPQKVHPYSIVLFDEMEKAPDEVLKALLGLMDEGTMTDSTGEQVCFKNSIIIFTTNFGADHLGGSKQFGFQIGNEPEAKAPGQADLEAVKKRLSERLGPETINRFRDFILFEPLKKEDLRSISRITLQNVAKQVGERKKIKFSFSEHLADQIAEKGYDPASGARAVRRICDELVRGAIARAITEWPDIDDFHSETNLCIDLPTPNILQVTQGDRSFMLPVSDDLKHLYL